MKTASWVIRERATGRAILETFKPVPASLKPEYEAIPILEYLQSINRKIQEDKCTM